MHPLEGITVLDLTCALSRAYCTMLADSGACVIKIEQPDQGDDARGWGSPGLGATARAFSASTARRKVHLDFKQPQGREVLNKLITTSDVLVKNLLLQQDGNR